MEDRARLLPFRFYSNQGVQSEQRQQGCTVGGGAQPSGSQGLPKEREGEDSKLRHRPEFKGQQKHRQVRRQQGGQAGVSTDISERERGEPGGRLEGRVTSTDVRCHRVNP